MSIDSLRPQINSYFGEISFAYNYAIYDFQFRLKVCRWHLNKIGPRWNIIIKPAIGRFFLDREWVCRTDGDPSALANKWSAANFVHEITMRSEHSRFLRRHFPKNC